MYTLFATTVHQQVAADRRHRFLGDARRTRLRHQPVAPDLIRTVDLGRDRGDPPPGRRPTSPEPTAVPVPPVLDRPRVR